MNKRAGVKLQSMHFQVIFLSESFATEFAREGFFPCVNELMTFQDGFSFKSSATGTTFEQVIWMRPVIVVPKTTGGTERSVTLVTLEVVQFLWLWMHLVIVMFGSTQHFVTVELVHFWWLIFF